MVSVKQFLPRLQFFAESFTGYPVKILIPSEKESEEELVQVQDSLKIYVPREVHAKDEGTGFNYFKGLVALQSSAALYNGIPKEEVFNISKIKRSRNLDDFIIEGERGGLIPLTYQTIELSRRMQCINEDYRVLGEDMRYGFQNMFDPRLLKKSKKADSMNEPVTNEIDLALTSAYWKNLGVNPREIQKIVDGIPRDKQLGILREEVQEVLGRLVKFNSPLNTSYRDSVERASDFAQYLYDLTEDMGMGSILHIKTIEEYSAHSLESQKIKGIEYKIDQEDLHDKLIKNIDSRKKELTAMLDENSESEIGLNSKENIIRRLSILDERRKNLQDLRGSRTLNIEQHRYFDAERYAMSEGASLSLRTVFQDVSRTHLVKLEVPERLEEQEYGNIFHLPELRDGMLVPNAVRVIIYDLRKDLPPTEQQIRFQLGLESEISKLEREIAEHNNKIHSDINYIYDNLPQIVKSRDQAQRKMDKVQKQLNKSRKIHEEMARRDMETDAGLTRRIEKEMEAIKPSARSIVRNCFEGELDEKKFFEWWLDEKMGGNQLPNFYYQWQKRKRDVASVLLIDASQSAERLAGDDKSILDFLKQSAYYFSLGADFLEDKSAVLAYNGKGYRNSRIFLLKDFSEDPRRLEERLELLKGELNNRDGSAIRYATQLLNDIPAKTRFLFHLGDMQPSDIEYEHRSPGFETYRYEGEGAFADVTHAFNSARSYGIIPVGICIKKPDEQKPKKTISEKPKGKLNLKVLKKLKQEKAKTNNIMTDEILKQNFQNNYKIVENPIELPKVLRDVYVRTSFQ